MQILSLTICRSSVTVVTGCIVGPASLTDLDVGLPCLADALSLAGLIGPARFAELVGVVVLLYLPFFLVLSFQGFLSLQRDLAE